MITRRVGRGLAVALLVGIVALPGASAAHALPPAVAAAAGAMELAGEGEMRWLGFKLYDAALWVEPGRAPDDADHALAIRYARAISAERLIEVSLEEMRRLGERDEAKLARWRSLLQQALPSVAAGDTLVGLHRSGRGVSFWHQGRLTARIDDAELARAFFAIWLDQRTREPELRARLLGRADTP